MSSLVRLSTCSDGSKRPPLLHLTTRLPNITNSERHLVQIMSENDLEQKAFAEFTLARCIIAAGEATRTSIQLPCIHHAGC